MHSFITSNLYKVQEYMSHKGLDISLNEVEKTFTKYREALRKEDKGSDSRAFKMINTYVNIAGSDISKVSFSPESFDDIKRKFEGIVSNQDSDKVIEFIHERVLPYCKDNPTDIIGISLPFTSQILYALVIGVMLKRKHKNLKVVLGGPQISMFNELITKHAPFTEAFDYLVYSQGELALKKLLDTLSAGNKAFEKVPSLIYFKEDGSLAKNAEENVRDIDTLPEPDFTDLDLGKYIYAKLPYQISRGCYWGRCEFCSYRETKGFVSKDLDKVIETVKNYKRKYGVRLLHFIDDSLQPLLLDTLLNKIQDAGIRFKYECYLRLDKKFTPEFCNRLKESGLKSALFGVESANQRVLNKMKKGYRVEQIKEVLQNMKNAGIENVISCLIGFPTETEEEAWDTVEFLKENKDLYHHAVIVHYGLISDMFKHKDDFGITKIDFDHLERYDDAGFCALGYPYETNVGMTKQQAIELIKKGREYSGLQLYKESFFT